MREFKNHQVRSYHSGFVHFIVLLIVIVTLVFTGYYFLKIRSQNIPISLPNNTNPFVNRPTPTPTPFPFQELTIPYLRDRTYQSSLGELKEVSKNSNYTSYLTSYDSDGLKIYGLLTIPVGTQPEAKYPAIIFVHGYIPPEEYRTTVNYNSYVDYLTKNGFVVFKIDLRGHDKSEGESGGGYYSGDYIIDTLNAHAALQNSDFVDPNRIGLWGHSMAGNVVFRSFVAKQNIPAVVIWAGAGYTYSHLTQFRIQDNSYRPPPTDSPQAKKRQELRETHGSFEPNDDFWKQVNPINYLEGVGGAIQIHHAVNDNVVSIEYARNLMKILEGTSIVHNLQEYPSGGHNLTGSSFNQAMQSTVKFFRENLH